VADREATKDEATAADESRERFAGTAHDVAEHEESIQKRGAKIEGEGEIK
jgi:hypothetical protein